VAVIVEDGSVVVDANSYLSLIEAQALGTDLGLDLTALSESQLIQATVEINKYSSEFMSTRADESQGVLVDFPRLPFTDNNGFSVDANTIPTGVKYAQAQAASDILAGYIVYGTDDGKSTASEAVSGAVSVSYFNTGKDKTNRSDGTINYLKPYIDGTSSLLAMGQSKMLVNY